MKLKRFFSLALVLAIFLLCLASCNLLKETEKLTDEELITRRIEAFSEAYNNGDMEAVFDCLDTKTGKKFKAIFNIVGGIAGSLIGFDIDLTELFSIGVGVVDGDYIKLQIKDINVVDDKNAVVTTVMDMQHSQTMTIYFIMVYEKDDWYIHDMTDIKMGGNAGSSVPIWKYEDNSQNGLTEISFIKDGALYQGIVNSEGKIIYSVRKAEDESYIFIGKDTVLVVEANPYTEAPCPVKLINGSGDLIKTWDVSEYDRIVDYGDGMLMVYKSKSTIEGTRHIYEILNEEGESCQGELILNKEFYSEHSKYLGDGVFAVCTNTTYGGKRDYYFINAGSGKQFKVNGWEGGDPTFFKDGKMFVQSYCHIYDNINADTPCVSLSTFVLSSNGEVTDLEVSGANVIWHENGYLAYSMDNKAHIIDIRDLSKQAIIYDAYDSSMVERVMMNDEYGAIALRGKDNRLFLSMIDKNGNQLNEPVATNTDWWDESNIKYSEGVFIYKNEKGKLCILNENGKESITEYSYIGEFVNGVAVAESLQDENTSYSFINKNGEIINPVLVIE